MHILLTDILTCPRCGPEFGLILLADELRDRRVHEGTLGCANCRGRWPVRRGFGRFALEDSEVVEGAEGTEDFTTEDTEGTEGGTGNRTRSWNDEKSESDEHDEHDEYDEYEKNEATRIAALLGVTEGPANVLVTGPAARHAARVADLVEDLEVVAADASLAAETERRGVSRIAVGARLPFYGGKLRGVWLGGVDADRLLEEGARVLGPLGRLVLEPAPEHAEVRLAAAGLRILARRDDTVVAGRTA